MASSTAKIVMKLYELEHGARLPKNRPVKRNGKASRDYSRDDSSEDTDH